MMETIDFSMLPCTQLEHMADAGARVLECYRVLGKAGMNVVSEVLREQGEFIEFEHYPRGDVFDTETHSRYYYHAHVAKPESTVISIPFCDSPACPRGYDRWIMWETRPGRAARMRSPT